MKDCLVKREGEGKCAIDVGIVFAGNLGESGIYPFRLFASQVPENCQVFGNEEGISFTNRSPDNGFEITRRGDGGNGFPPPKPDTLPSMTADNLQRQERQMLGCGKTGCHSRRSFQLQL